MQNDLSIPGREMVISNEQLKPTIDQMISEWLFVKLKKSDSQATFRQFKSYMQHFRDALHLYGLDLDSDEVLVARFATKWASELWTLPVNHRTYGSLSARTANRTGPITPNTFRSRITAISSFYDFARKRRWMSSNPMQIVDRPNLGEVDYAKPYTNERVTQVLEGIDRSTFQGKRDYAVLSVFFCTGRRLLEVTMLNWGDFTLQGEHTATLYFRRTKGNKQIKDQLPSAVVDAILDYMRAIHGHKLAHLPGDAPLWHITTKNDYVNLDERLGPKGVAYIFKRHFGTLKTHTARHTLATYMRKQNAPTHMIQAQLGHKSIQTTEMYIERDEAVDNPYTAKFANTVGITTDAPAPVPTGPRKVTSAIDETILAYPTFTNYALAKMLQVSPHTIRKHKEKLFSKS